MTPKQEIQRLTDHLTANVEKINISHLAKRLKIDQSTANRAINNLLDMKGRVVRIPKRCAPELQKYIDELKLKSPRN